MDLGAGLWETFRLVTFPQFRSSFITGASLAFALRFNEVYVTVFTAPPGCGNFALLDSQGDGETQSGQRGQSCCHRHHSALSNSGVRVATSGPGRRRRLAFRPGLTFIKRDCGPDSARPGSLVQELAETLTTLSHGWCED